MCHSYSSFSWASASARRLQTPCVLIMVYLGPRRTSENASCRPNPDRHDPPLGMDMGLGLTRQLMHHPSTEYTASFRGDMSRFPNRLLVAPVAFGGKLLVVVCWLRFDGPLGLPDVSTLHRRIMASGGRIQQTASAAVHFQLPWRREPLADGRNQPGHTDTSKPSGASPLCWKGERSEGNKVTSRCRNAL